jgi:dihydrodipicolinate reductase
MDNSATLAAAIDRQDSSMIGRDINNNHIAVVSSLLDVIDSIDVVIDFSSPLVAV